MKNKNNFRMNNFLFSLLFVLTEQGFQELQIPLLVLPFAGP